MNDSTSTNELSPITVAVLDDEEKVCRLVLQLADWEQHQMTVVGTAYNGLEGLNLIRQEQPDLVITDIRMPGMDGLELIAKIKEQNHKVEFIIISGHHQFEYAHKALRYGVEDYLLKPIKQTELNDTLYRISRKFIAKRKSEQSSLQLQEKWDRSKKKLRKDFFTEYVFSSPSGSVNSIKAINESYGFSFQEGNLQMIQFKLDCSPGSFSGKIMERMSEKADSLFQMHLNSHCFDYEYVEKECRIYLLINFPASSKNEIRHKLRLIYNELTVNMKIFESSEIFFSLGSPVLQPEELRASWKDTELLIAERLLTPGIYMFEDLPKYEKGICDKYLAEWNRKMEPVCDLLDSEAGISAVETLMDQLVNEDHSTGMMVLETVREAGHRFFLLLKDRNYRDLSVQEVEKEFDRDLNLLKSTGQINQYLKDLIHSQFSSLKAVKEQEDSQPIRDAKIYISRNYSENTLSLDKVALSAGLSGSYFSALFKQQTGEGFLDYLTAVRMEKAKEILRSGNRTVSSIASDVGYNDTKYFTKLFKKHTGLKPSEFRKIYG